MRCKRYVELGRRSTSCCGPKLVRVCFLDLRWHVRDCVGYLNWKRVWQKDYTTAGLCHIWLGGVARLVVGE